MKYIGVSKSEYKYILVTNLLIAILVNVLLLVISVVLDIFFDIKFKIIINLLEISFTIFLYIWAFLITNTITTNYKYLVDRKKVEVIHGSVIVSRKIMLLKRIYKVEIKRSILGRIFKVASIKCFSSGGNIKIKYIDYEKVDDVYYKIKEGMDNG